MLKDCRNSHAELVSASLKIPKQVRNDGLLKKALFLLLITFSVFNFQFLKACQCPPTSLSLAECNKYELIFRGRIISTIACENNKGSAVFEISELYKGASTQTITVFYDCKTECTLEFNAGEQWIIYTTYKQINTAKMDWCSRSRRFIKNVKEDFYVLNYGNTYDEELTFLQKNLGIHSVLTKKINKEQGWNQIPTRTEIIMYMLAGLVGIVIIYFLFKKFVK